MKHLLVASAFALPLLAFSPSPATWQMDGAHAKVRFSITHLGINEVEGSFKAITASITAPDEDLTKATITFSADAKSINTDNGMRDDHLRSADFFDVEKHPAITFQSTAIAKAGADTYKVTGNLAIKGVTKAVELTARARYADHPMTKNRMAGVRVTGTIDRTEFGVGSGMAAAALGNTVEITANAEFLKQ